jgi:hypothetical protein
MIQVVISPPCRALMDDLGISESDAVATFNNRDQGLVDEGVSRIAAVRWFGSDRIVMVDGPIADRHWDDSRKAIRIEKVTATLVIELRSKLPAGTFDQSIDMETILAIVAESFGVPVSCHPDEPPSTLYAGPWDGKPPSFRTKPERTYVLCGSFDPDARYCEMVYAFDVRRYLEWFKKT